MAAENEATVLAIAGTADIQTINDVYLRLSKGLEQHDSVVLDTAAVESVDLTFIQLVEAARRSAARGGKSLRLAGPAHGSLAEALHRGGFLTSSADKAFWLHENGVV